MRRGRHGHRKTRLVLLVALAIAVPGVAAPEEAAQPRSDGRARLDWARSHAPSDALRFRGGERRPEPRTLRPGAVVVAAGDPRSPRTWAKAGRRMTERLWGVRVPDPLEQLRQAKGGDMHEEPDPAIVHIGMPGGDLTGDGLEDAISIDLDLNDYTVSAIRGLGGTNGAELWDLALPASFDAWGIPVGDLTGDGADDVLVTRLEVEHSAGGRCTPFGAACDYTDSYALNWHYSLHSGVDGQTIWSRSFAGESAERYIEADALLAYGYVFEWAATNAVVIAAPGADHDGDDGDDIVFDRFDIEALSGGAEAGVFPVYLAAGVPLISVSTTAEVASGRNGETFFTRSDGESQGGSLLLPTGDAVGDETPDLRWETLRYDASPFACAFVAFGLCYDASTAALDVEIIDGATLQPAWSQTVDDDAAYYTFVDSAGADLDGDGKQDLVIDDWWEWEVSTRSGATGDLGWLRGQIGYPVAVGPVGGSAGTDLVTVESDWSFDEDTGEESLTIALVRLDGGDGTELLRTESRWSSLDGWFDIALYLVGDSDADGVTDIAVDTIVIEPETFEVSSSHLVIEAGDTGEHVFTRDVDALSFGLPGGNLDGQDGDDLIDVSLSFVDDITDLRFDAYLLPSAVPAWSRTDTFQGYWDALLVVSGDQIGDGGDDAIYDRIVYPGDEVISRIDGVDGRTGVFAWGNGPPLPGVQLRGVLTGTVRDEHGTPVHFACVSALDPLSGEFLTLAYTRPDGTYRLSGLQSGDVKIYFQGCGRERYVSEFYDDEPDFDSADLVPVAEGGETTGIDAVLAGGLPPADPPANNAFADAEPISGRGFSLSTDTYGATTEAGEPRCGFSGATVWYAWTPGAPGPALLTTEGSDYDTVLAVYRGDSLGTLEQLACNDDTALSYQATVNFLADLGQTYFIQVGGFSGSSGQLLLSGL